MSERHDSTGILTAGPDADPAASGAGEPDAGLSHLISHLHRAHEEEKRVLARELHDELGSLLTAIKLDITYIKSKCAQAAPELVGKCDRVASMIDQGTKFKRRIIDQLRPSTLDMLGLGPAVRELVDTFSAETKTAAEVEVSGEITPPPEAALAIYRMVEEALANVRRHAQASSVTVVIERVPEALRVHVSDDGRGFDAGASRQPGGNGLAVIRQRCQAMGGRLSVRSAPGAGTSIEARLPLSTAARG